VGPGLEAFDLIDVLSNPTLVLHREEVEIASNDDWEGINGDVDISAMTRITTRVGAFALQTGSHDAALLIRLDPGVYTAQVGSADRGTGLVLVEVYAVP
jgi:hypothetical protein